MKVEIGNTEQYIFDKIKHIRFTFDDDTEITLNEITDFSLDLDSIDYSQIDITNALFDKELQNHFRGYKVNKVKEIFIDGIIISRDGYEEGQVLYNIPCEMRVRRLILNGDLNTSSMRVVLEGDID